jgi:hypothetical protein
MKRFKSKLYLEIRKKIEIRKLLFSDNKIKIRDHAKKNALRSVDRF